MLLRRNSSTWCKSSCVSCAVDFAADVTAAQEFNQIKRFVAECRRQWPGAMIVLRPK